MIANTILETSSNSSHNRQGTMETPIFRLQRVDIKMKELIDSNVIKASTQLSKLVRANNIVVFTIADSMYRVTFTGNETRHERVIIPLRPDDAVDQIFLDYTGCHCIVSLQRGDCMSYDWFFFWRIPPIWATCLSVYVTNNDNNAVHITCHHEFDSKTAIYFNWPEWLFYIYKLHISMN